MKTLLLSIALLGLGGPAWAQSAKADLKDYVGTYTFSQNFQRLIIEEKDGALYGELDSYGKYKYNPKDDPDTFQSTSSYGTIFVFRRNPTDNKVTGVTLRLMGQEVSGEKVK